VYYGISDVVGLVQSVVEIYRDIDETVEAIMSASRGLLEVVGVVSRDLSIVSMRSSGESFLNEVEVEAVGGVIMGVVYDVLRSIDFSSPQEIRIQLDDRRYLIIQPYMDYFIVCLTKQNVRIGFIELILEYYRAGSKKSTEPLTL
jgi:predicted regulator of Ras-like GTPase activity (Roadblock/LC7/MglB family)